MSQNSFLHPPDPLDITYEEDALLDLMFADLARSPNIAGKNHYLPLTRMVERGRLLDKLRQPSYSSTLSKIVLSLNKTSKRLSAQCGTAIVWQQIAAMSIGKLDTFFLDGNLTILDLMDGVFPVSKQEASNISPDRRQIWYRYFYLLSLLPPPTGETLDYIDPRKFVSHLRKIDLDYRTARQRLAEGTLRYAVRSARLYINSGIPYIDLIQEAIIGLLTAIDRYEENKGSHLQSYAANWIHQRLHRYVAEFARLIRIPVHRIDELTTKAKQVENYRETKGDLLNIFDLLIGIGQVTSEEISVVNEQLRNQQRYKRLNLQLKAYERLYKNMDKDEGYFPKDIQAKADKLKTQHQKMLKQDGRAPRLIDILVALEWITIEDLAFLNTHASSSANFLELRSRYTSGRRLADYYQMMFAQHYEFEETAIRFSQDNDCFITLESYVCDEMDVEEAAMRTTLRDELQSALGILTHREQRVLCARFGLMDGVEATLEEIGQEIGVTRERIRQIEAKALKKLRHPARSRKLRAYYEESVVTNLARNRASNMRSSLVTALADRSLVENVEETEFESIQRERADALIEKYLYQGRKRISGQRSKSQRTYLIRKVLQEAGAPLHYAAIHEKAVSLLGNAIDFALRTTYATLFYDEEFRSYGDGVFGLANWDPLHKQSDVEVTLYRCPQPLLSTSGDPRSLFESVMVGREVLKRNPEMSAQEFWSNMLAWSNQSLVSIHIAQSAFDVWYAVGLMERVDFVENPFARVKLTVPVDAKLGDVRIHCLENICRRIAKMPELLLAVDRIAHSSLDNIQVILFGSEQSGSDIGIRLAIFEAFEAVRKEGSTWRLTSLGQTILEGTTIQELPDFGEALATEEPIGIEDTMDTDWDEELDLLDF